MVDKVSLYESQEAEHRRKLAFTTNLLAEGKTNAKSVLTLSSSAVTTVVNDDRVSSDSHISVTATTANAANENIYIVCANKSFTVHHGSTASTDRIFTYTVSTP